MEAFAEAEVRSPVREVAFLVFLLILALLGIEFFEERRRRY